MPSELHHSNDVVAGSNPAFPGSYFRGVAQSGRARKKVSISLVAAIQLSLCFPYKCGMNAERTTSTRTCLNEKPEISQLAKKPMHINVFSNLVIPFNFYGECRWNYMADNPWMPVRIRPRRKTRSSMAEQRRVSSNLVAVLYAEP